MGLAEYRERTVWTELALRRLMREDVEISDEMLKSYYAERRALYVEPERVRISQIFVAPGLDGNGTPGPEEWSVAEAAIVKAHTRLRLGEDFKKVEEEVGPGGKGDGWFERGELLRELEDVAFALGAGAVSAPIKTGHGYHIIRTEAKRERRTPEFDEIKARLAEEYREKFFLVMAGEYMTRLKDTALKDKALVLTVGNGE